MLLQGGNDRTLCISLRTPATNKHSQKSPPWACGKGCAEACAERFSALKMDFILYLAPVPAAQIIHPDCDLKAMSTFHSSLWRNKHGDPQFFSQVFAKNSLIKTYWKKKKSLIVEHYFFGENSFVFGVFGPKRGLQANHGTVRKSAISPQHAIRNELNEVILLISIKGALFWR